jgi:hypothetical protein
MERAEFVETDLCQAGITSRRPLDPVKDKEEFDYVFKGRIFLDSDGKSDHVFLDEVCQRPDITRMDSFSGRVYYEVNVNADFHKPFFNVTTL